MFQYCYSLQTVPLLNTALGTSFSNMFSYCYSLQTVPLLNTAIGTNFGSMFQDCYSLTQAALSGTSKTISYASCYLSQAALVDVFNGLSSGVVGQTITVTGNPGTASLTVAEKAIATDKGWTLAL